jgi:hypothetical protein
VGEDVVEKFQILPHAAKVTGRKVGRLADSAGEF